MTDNNLKSIYLGFGILMGFSLFFLRMIDISFKPLIFVILLFGLLFSAARGPLIFYALSLLLVAIFKSKRERDSFVKLRPMYFLPPVIFMILVLTNASILESIINLMQQTVDRFSAFLSRSGGESVSTRLELYSLAIEMFSDNLFLGNGLGSFGLYVTGIDQKLYPHNILLELLSETGIFSILILLLFILLLSKKLFKNSIVTMISLYAFMNMMKSNSFEELRMFFGLLSVGLLYANRVKYNIILHPMFLRDSTSKTISDRRIS